MAKQAEKYDLIEDFKQTLRNLTHLIINVSLYKDRTYYLLLNDSPLNLMIKKSEIERALEQLSLGETHLIDTLTDMIYQIYKARTEHSDNDWNHFHDVLLSATNTSYSNPELEKLLVIVMPIGLRDSSYTWGMNDTSWRDDVYEWAINALEVKETEDGN